VELTCAEAVPETNAAVDVVPVEAVLAMELDFCVPLADKVADSDDDDSLKLVY
jgi:hypothetical protein